jgi:hypothetical protein
MSTLDTNPRIARPDDVYQMLVDAHRGLDDADSMKLYAKLVLLLANHIGDAAVLAEAIALARAGSVPADAGEPAP